MMQDGSCRGLLSLWSHDEWLWVRNLLSSPRNLIMNEENLKIVLAYLIKNGVQYDGDSNSMGGWNFYGGCFETVSKPVIFLPQDIDLKKTEMPSYDTRYEFVDTGMDSVGVDVIYTKVVLNDERKVWIGCRKPHEQILDLIQNSVMKNFREEAEEFWKD